QLFYQFAIQPEVFEDTQLGAYLLKGIGKGRLLLNWPWDYDERLRRAAMRSDDRRSQIIIEESLRTLRSFFIDIDLSDSGVIHEQRWLEEVERFQIRNNSLRLILADENPREREFVIEAADFSSDERWEVDH